MDSLTLDDNAEATGLKVAHEAGQHARMSLERAETCPFEFGSAFWHAWQGGWLLEESRRLRESAEILLKAQAPLSPIIRRRCNRCFPSMWGIWDQRYKRFRYDYEGTQLVSPSPIALSRWVLEAEKVYCEMRFRVAKFPVDPKAEPTEFWPPDAEADANGLESHE